MIFSVNSQVKNSDGGMHTSDQPQCAPVALFTYNRPVHTLKTLAALQKNPEAKKTALYIFADGPKTNATNDDIARIKELREVIHAATGFKEIHIIEQKINIGLANSIINGVRYVLERHPNLIVLEDDILVNKYFLEYMNSGLQLYADEEQVVSINAYNPGGPVSYLYPETFFIKGADCQGWATWRRGWALFEPDGKKLFQDLHNSNLVHEFNFGGAYPYISLLHKQIMGQVDSWAIRWYASTFLASKLSLFPATSLVYNIGFGTLATHTLTAHAAFNKNYSEDKVTVFKQIPVENNEIRKAYGAGLNLFCSPDSVP